MTRPDAEAAMAAALHDTDETCNASYFVSFEECATREWDIKHAAEVLAVLRSKGWRLVSGDEAGSMNWLHEALNSGDGVYRP